MSEDKRFELMKTYKERFDKFVYYIVGLNIASLGFIFSKTFEITLYYRHDIILGIAIVCWVTSTTAAFRWIFIQTRTMEVNLEIYDLQKGFYNKDRISDKSKGEQISQGKKQLERDNIKCEWAIRITILFFVFGMLSFVFWRGIIIFS